MLEIFQSLFAPPRHLILLIVAAWLGLGLAERCASRHGIDREVLSNLIFYALLVYIIAGRLLFAAAHLAAFLQAPASIFSPNTDLFDPLGGAVAAIGAAALVGRRKRVPLWPALDAITPFLSVLAIGLGLSHLAEGSAFGKPTDVPWAIDLWNARRHPSQVYETLTASVILIVVLVKRSAYAGQLFLTFAALSAGARLFLEAYRGDSQLLAWGLRLPQVVAWLVLFAILVLFEVRQRHGNRLPSPYKDSYTEELDHSPASRS